MVDDIDVYRNFDAIRNDIGFVPQKDIIHMELTTFQALDYAAQLRMPPDTTKAERHQRVMEVLEDLDLAHRKDVQISGLSGGQQKRVSIGVELLTKPSLFFLDEPTSGLDPGTETSLMHLMRRLADQGRTIVLITHATKNVMLADKVIFLARGGYVAWFGPPDEALKYFDGYRSERDRRGSDIEFDEIYGILDNSQNGTAADWAERYQGNPAYQRYIVQELQDAQVGTAPGTVSKPKGRSAKSRISSLRQLLILSARNIRILLRDRFSLGLMLAAAPLVSLLDVILASLGNNPLSFEEEGDPFMSLIVLFMLPLYGVMVGGLATMREIVKEQEIYKRERLVNLKIFPYVVSKIWVAAILALYQAGVYTIVRYIAFVMPSSIVDFATVYIIMVLATMSGMMLGLFSSALAPNANSAPLIVILFMIPQIVLGGALVPVGQIVSAPMATRWAFEGLMAVSGIGSDVDADVCWDLPEETRAAMTLEDKAATGCNCMGVAMLHADSCNFPGLGEYYDPLIDEPAPVEPGPAPGQPPRPVFPEEPVKPADESDQVAMAEYFDELEVFQAEVDQVQADFDAQLEQFDVSMSRYTADLTVYQEQRGLWEAARLGSVTTTEELVRKLVRDFGWTFVDKNNFTKYWGKIGKTWIAQITLIGLLFAGTLILQKRKDTI
jgi:ABC-type multidrug transport system ATPase subunit